jgi:subtilisin family serine protease
MPAAKLPRRIFAQASPTSVGGTSMFSGSKAITTKSVAEFRSDPRVITRAKARLRRAGFDVLASNRLTINIAGSATTYRRAFGSSLRAVEREVLKERRERGPVTFIEVEETPVPGLIDTSESDLADVVEGVAIEEPAVYYAAPRAKPFPPKVDYWHLEVPGDVSLALNADVVHRDGITGSGVKVVMSDTGWFRHPFFERRGYRATDALLGPGAVQAGHDEVGHGTGESANAFAAAPDIEFRMVKNGHVNLTGGFNAAVGLAPDVISCSWGYDIRNGPLPAANQALAASVAQAVADGIVVVFSAGNGHYGFPGQHPDVISAGGTYMDQNGKLRASNYSSGFESQIYSGRKVPDVCGLVGQVPAAAYIMLPLEPGDDIDATSYGGNHPQRDETKRDDGWAAFSGTSAAAPQIAGVCALIKEACPALDPAEIRDILKRTARDVTEGSNAHRERARAGRDLATGAGLVDAEAAVKSAIRRCGP